MPSKTGWWVIARQAMLLLYFPLRNRIHFPAMSSFRFPALLLALPMVSFSLFAQEPGEIEGLLPDGSVPPPVDLIEPVPAPEIPIGAVLEGPVLPENLRIDNQGGSITGNMEEGVTLGGPVHVQGDNGLEIFSNRARIDLKEKSVTFDGDVSVFQGNVLQRGQRTVYFYETRVLDASGLRVSMDPILLESGKFTGQTVNGKQVFIGENAGITTDDSENPGFWVRSDVTTVYPGDRVTFKNLKLYAGDTPVFWLPYLSQPLSADLGYHFVPGARSNWGPYLLNTYGIMLGGTRNELTGENEDAWLLSQWRFDLRASRGAAFGLDLSDIRQQDSEEISGLSLYHLYDLDPGDSRNGLPRSDVDENRYQVQLRDRREFDWEKEADWRFDTNITLLSDQFYLEDLAPNVFRNDPAPDNTLGFFRRSDESLLSVYGRLRLNDFYRVDTQSPEIAFDQVRKPLFGLPLLHEGQSSFSVRGEQASDVTRRNILDPLLTPGAVLPGSALENSLLFQLNSYEADLVRRIRAGDPSAASLRAQLLDTGFNRLHTNHTFSLPLAYRDWFTFTPQAGAAYTNYSSVQGPADSDSRLMYYGGAEAAVKFSKDYGNRWNSLLGLDGLLHQIQPYANWSVLAADELDQDYPKIDRLTFTTRPRSLDPARYTAIDEFNSWNILRLGVRNQMITRRDGQSHEWLFLDTYMDQYLDDPEGNRSWSNLYNDVRWQPLPWLGIDLESQVPVVAGGSGFTELSTRARFQPYQDMEIGIGYRHLNNHPVLLDSERIDLSTYLRLSENWGIGSHHIFEMADGTLEVQQYTLHRDFGNWVAGVGLTQRDNRLEEEYGIVFSLSLKDFSQVSLPFSIDAE